MLDLPNLVSNLQTLGQALREQMTTEKAVLNAIRTSVQRIDMDANGVNDSADEYIDSTAISPNWWNRRPRNRLFPAYGGSRKVCG